MGYFLRYFIRLESQRSTFWKSLKKLINEGAENSVAGDKQTQTSTLTNTFHPSWNSAVVYQEKRWKPQSLERYTYRRNSVQSTTLSDVAIPRNNATRTAHASRYSHERFIPSMNPPWPCKLPPSMDGKTTRGQKQTEGKNESGATAWSH